MPRRTAILLTFLAVIVAGAVIAQRWISAQERLETCSFDEAQLAQLSTDADHRVLFIGNSFIGNHGVDEMLRELLVHATTDSATSFRVWGPGMTLSGHVGYEGSSQGQCLRTLLSEADAPVGSWDLVVLQEQSRTPTLPQRRPQMQAAAATLAERAQHGGAKVLLLATWGYRDGDPQGSEDVRNFAGMTRSLDTNTREVATSLRPLDVGVAPAGLGFLKVYEDVQREGSDPTAPNSAFRQLYAPDGHHPSPQGSYLAACVVYAAYTGASPAGIDWAPAGVSPSARDYLHSVAADVVLSQR